MINEQNNEFEYFLKSIGITRNTKPYTYKYYYKKYLIVWNRAVSLTTVKYLTDGSKD